MLFVLCPLLFTYRGLEEMPPLCKEGLAKQDGGIVEGEGVKHSLCHFLAEKPPAFAQRTRFFAVLCKALDFSLYKS